jgi:hypothetical protein
LCHETVKRYEFLDPSEGNGYLLFPESLESNEHIFFHGTAETNLASILKTGFKISGILPSVSFAKRSSLSLKYACESRCLTSPRGVVIAAMFECLNSPHIARESFGIHVYGFDTQPFIVGYCIVPASYLFL